MIKIDTGGLAYPRENYRSDSDELSVGQSGITLLDYFAGQALAGLISSLSTIESMEKLTDEIDKAGIPRDRVEWLLSKRSYGYATAMIAEKRRLEGDEKP